MATKSDKSQNAPQQVDVAESDAPAFSILDAPSDDPIASADDKVLAHLANPIANPLPEGTVINFGWSEPVRRASSDELREAPRAVNADHH